MKKNRFFFKNTILFITLISISVLNVKAQTGPGGIGNNSGAGNLKFWLRGDSVSIDVGVDTLFDLSGYNNHFVQSNTSYQPATSTLNGFNVLDFDGSGDNLLDDDGESYINGQTAFTLLFVTKSDNSSTNKGLLITEDPASSDDILSIRYSATGTFGGQANIITASTGANGPIESSAGTQSTSNQLITFTWTSNATPELYIDGTKDVLSYGNLIVGSISGSDKVILGKGSLDLLATDGWDGIIGEAIYFNKQLSSAERTIVENYLSSRYNLVISNDKFTTNLATFIYDVIGIGTESDGKHSGSVSAGFGLYEDNSTLNVNGEYVFASHDNTTSDIASIQTGSNVTNCGAESAWARDWYVEKFAGSNVDLRMFFDFGDGIEGGGVPQNITNYRLLYKPTPGADYSVVNTTSQGIQSGDQIYFEVTNAEITNGYYTIGSIDQTNSPVEGNSTQTWYTLVGGNWTSSSIWTLDPSGALPNNPKSEIPDASDNVVILSGKTVTISENGKLASSIKVTGRLELGATFDHDFTEINGEGRIILSSDKFPAGDSTDFITKGMGEGTVVFKGGGYNLTTAHTFYHMEVELDNLTDTLYMVEDYQINGNLIIKKGILQINDDSNTTPINLLVKGTTTVKPDCQFNVGDENVVHYAEFQGDVVNDGTIDFSNNAQYSCAANGGVRVIFTGATNNTLTCNGPTDLYRMIVDKGTDQTYILSVISTNTAYFNLYGPISGGACIDPIDGLGGWERLALVIYNGTLKLGSNINIPRLGENRSGNSPNEFHIPPEARLWINGATVATTNTAGGWRGITVYGTLQVDAGSFTNPAGTGGITYFSNVANPGKLLLNGGDIYSTQLKQDNSTGRFTYIQTGGNFYLNGLSDSRNSSAVFALPDADHVFEMSDGLIQIEAINTTTINGIHILCQEGNYNVTGGTIELLLPTLDAAEIQFDIKSTSPFYNLIITDSGNAGTQPLVMDTSLTILNDLTIGAGTELQAKGNDLLVGGDFILEDGASFVHGNNTTYFNGNQNTEIDIDNNSNNPALTFYNVVIEKDQRSNPSLFWDVGINNCPGRNTTIGNPNNTIIQITNNLTITRGQFTIERYTVSLNDSLSITNGKIIYNPLLPGQLELNGSAQQVITGSALFSPVFGNIELNNTFGAKITTNIDMDYFTLTTGIIDINEFKLSIDTNFVDGSSFGVSKMIMTNGLAGDRGLELSFNLDATTPSGDYITTYPVGIAGEYTPVDVWLENSLTGSYTGTYAINPVDGFHPSMLLPTVFLAIPYYWKSEVTGTIANIDPADIFLRFTHSNLTFWNFKRKYIEDFDFVTGSPSNNVNSSPWTFEDIGFITSDYTLSDNVSVVGTNVYYSRQTGFWDDRNTWSNTSHTGNRGNSEPGYNDIVIIKGDGTNNHTVTIRNNNETCSQLYVRSAENGTTGIPTLDIATRTGHSFDEIHGGGLIQISYNGDVPNGDWEAFMYNDTAIFEYYGAGYDIPSDFEVYPNLLINGTVRKTLPNNIDVLVRKNLFVDGDELRINNNDDLIIQDSLIVENGGSVRFGIGNKSVVTVNKSIDLSGAGSNSIYINNGGTYTDNHRLNVYEDIVLSTTSSIDLFNSNAVKTADLYFMGDNSSTINAATGASLDFNRIIINKSVNTADVDILEDFSLNGATNGLSSEKALYLISGDLTINNSSTIDLTTGGGDFRIPVEASLSVINATVSASGNNTGIYLDGYMQVGDGSNWLINGVGNNNYIVYSSSGNAKIAVNQGTLRVGAQIRRSTTTEQGILTFRQEHANSTVVIGEQTVDKGSRGVFEILNSGSSFYQVADANITIAQPQVGASVAALLLEPSSDTINSGASFTFGDDTYTPAGQTLGINSKITLENIVVNSTNTPTVQLQTRGLSINGDLTIEPGAGTGPTFDANGLYFNIKGDLINSGVFEPNGNITTFNGVANQQIIGSADFYDLVKSTSDTLSLNGTTSSDITIANDFTISAGTFRDSSNTVIIEGDLSNDGTHIFGGVGNGLEMAGSSLQELSGNGIIGKLTISNPSGVNVLTGNQVTIVDALNLNGGVLDVGSNLLDLGVNADIIAGAVFGNTNMIRTNISFTDNGVQKTFKSIADAGGPYNYIIPIGSGTKYTPVDYKITTNTNSSGKIVTKAADERHPSIIEDSETPEIEDVKNVLQYHWVLKSDGMSGFTADVEMQYYPGDVYVTSPYTVSDYITARLLNDGSGSWNKFTADDFDEANNLCHFNFSNVGDLEIEGDYTAGIDSAIPNQVPFYETKKSGSWTDSSIWVPNVLGGPRGAMVRINTNDTVYMPGNFQSSYTTTIDGTLKVDSTFGHRLGEVDGTGTLYTKRASLPAGYYESFFSTSGGTLEYGGSSSYDILATFSQINHLKLSGKGERRFPNQDVTLLGDFIIDGDDLTLNVINDHNQKISIGGDISLITGLFDAGERTYPNAIVELNGTSAQTITGDFTGLEKDFNHLVINNSNGVTFNNSADINGNLTFNSGIITMAASQVLSMTYFSNTITGAGSTAYVDGILNKTLAQGGTFTFPVGDGGRYAPTVITNTQPAGTYDWEVEYFDANPITDPMVLDPTSMGVGLQLVSEYEYWRVNGPASGTAQNTIRWDSQSILPAMTSDRTNNIKMVEWTGAQWDTVYSVVNDGGINSGTILSGNSLSLNGNNYFTIGTVEGTPLPAAGFVSPDTSICAGTSAGLRIQLTGTAPWTIKVDSAGINWTITGINTSLYTLNTDPVASTTYTITEVTDATPTTSTTTIFGSPVTVTVVPLPTPTIVPAQVLQTFCVGETTNYSVTNNAGNTYNWVVNGGSILAGQGTNAVFVEWLTDPGDIEVTETTPETCPGTNNINPVTINPIPIANDQTPPNLCSELVGDSVLVTALDLTALHTAINNGGGVTFSWYEDAALIVAVGTPANTSINDNFGASISITKIFYCEVDNGTCTDVATVTYTVYRVPETGPQYHINNNWGN